MTGARFQDKLKQGYFGYLTRIEDIAVFEEKWTPIFCAR
jgi:hypothetical protein